MMWEQIFCVILSNLTLAKPVFREISLLQSPETSPVFPHFWLEFFLIIVVVLLLFIWLRARMKIRQIVGSSKVSFECFCDKYHISNREKEILNLVLDGKSCSEIEKLLFISKNTVRNHVHSIYKKLNVKNRVALINLVRKSVAQGLGE